MPHTAPLPHGEVWYRANLISGKVRLGAEVIKFEVMDFEASSPKESGESVPPNARLPACLPRAI